ncbi:MAG: excisionase family DNA-binding protein [Candidatus Kapabacteria bacterium]|jgi:excisionase family DNA binding protein|nr:excisionase family DNA-binding protein [Candidatus Kapabacteria bacterium]
MDSKITLVSIDELKDIIKESVRDETTSLVGLLGDSEKAQPITDQGLMTRKQLKEYLQCSYPTIDKMVREETIPHLRAGKKILFSKNEVMKALSPNSDQIKKKYGGKNVN